MSPLGAWASYPSPLFLTLFKMLTGAPTASASLKPQRLNHDGEAVRML